MKKLIIISLATMFFLSCAEEKKSLTITGNVKGLKKGMLYLQKVEDSILVDIDSLKIKGKSNFSFSTDIEEPEVLFLYLDKNDGNDLNDQIEFFAEPGHLTINTTVDHFVIEAKIEGSETHKKLEDYKKMLSGFTDRNLNYVKENLEYWQKGDSLKADSIQKLSDKNLLRTYQYTINYALQNKDSYVTPYIILNRANSITVKYLDSVKNSLTPEVANSKYGVALNNYIERVKKNNEEQNNDE